MGKKLTDLEPDSTFQDMAHFWLYALLGSTFMAEYLYIIVPIGEQYLLKMSHRVSSSLKPNISLFVLSPLTIYFGSTVCIGRQNKFGKVVKCFDAVGRVAGRAYGL